MPPLHAFGYQFSSLSLDEWWLYRSYFVTYDVILFLWSFFSLVYQPFFSFAGALFTCTVLGLIADIAISRWSRRGNLHDRQRKRAGLQRLAEVRILLLLLTVLVCFYLRIEKTQAPAPLMDDPPQP